MKKQFVTYNIALKLKELGFDESCLAFYSGQLHHLEIGFNWINNPNCKNSIIENIISAPLWQQAIDWFRDKYRYDIQIVYRHSDTDKVEGINSVYYDINIYHLSGGDAWKTYKCNQYSDDYYKTREQAILKTIELIGK